LIFRSVLFFSSPAPKRLFRVLDAPPFWAHSCGGIRTLICYVGGAVFPFPFQHRFSAPFRLRWAVLLAVFCIFLLGRVGDLFFEVFLFCAGTFSLILSPTVGRQLTQVRPWNVIFLFLSSSFLCLIYMQWPNFCPFLAISAIPFPVDFLAP